MKTKINKIDNDWVDIKNKCRTTVNKEYTENNPKSPFKTKLLISEHSPIRLLVVNWSWKNIKSWVATHFSRHKWERFIGTQRTDRTGLNRDELPQGELVIMDGSANAQSLIDTARKRLCFQASKETRELMEDLKMALRETEPELADVLVPNCIYRMGCPEFEQCGYFNSFLNGNIVDYDIFDIKTRYDLYNKDFNELHKLN